MNRNQNFDVSIVIRTKNEAEDIEACLRNIFSQETRYSFEVIIIDSGSTDNTIELCKQFPVRIESILPEDFNYGRTLNLGVQLAQGIFFIALSGHAIPANNHWLESLLASFKDEGVAATYSREIPRTGCNPLEARKLAALFGTHKIIFSLEWQSSIPELRSSPIIFSNAASCIRRSLLEEHPFRELSYGEDQDWAIKMVKQGYRLVYEPGAIVYHSHNESLRALYRRHLKIGQAKKERSGQAYQLPILFLRFFKETIEDTIFVGATLPLFQALKWSGYSLLRQGVCCLAMGKGSRSEV